MATLHEFLSKSSPAIAEDAVTQFRSGLVFIINRLHDEVAEGTQLSLLDQTKRLDDEGYDSCKLLIILNHVTEATIGSSATQELLSFIQENVAEPDGLPLLLAHVHSSFPELARAIDELEGQAIQEENQLLAVAGGMSKKAVIGLSVGGAATLLTATAIGVYRKRKSMLAERAIREEQAVRGAIREEQAVRGAIREEQALKDTFYRDIASNNLTKFWHDNRNKLFKEAIAKGANRVIISAIIIDPDRAIQPMKSLVNYTETEIEGYAERLALAHVMKFERAIEKQVVIAYEEELRDLEDSLRDKPVFKSEVKSILEQKGNDIEGLSWDDIKNLPGFNAIEKDLINSSWSKEMVIKFDKSIQGSNHILKGVYLEIKESYAAELTKEVKAAKNAAKKEATSRLESGDGKFARTAELKVDSDIVRKTKRLREAFSYDVRVLERQVEADIDAAERIGIEMDRIDGLD